MSAVLTRVWAGQLSGDPNWLHPEDTKQWGLGSQTRGQRMAEPTGDVRGGAEQPLGYVVVGAQGVMGKRAKARSGGPVMKSRGDHLLTWDALPTTPEESLIPSFPSLS